MKKVLIFSLSYFPHVGGAEVAIREITKRLPHIEFHVLTNRYDARLPRHEIIDAVHVHRIGIVTSAPTISDFRRFPLHLNKLLYQVWAPIIAHRLHRVHGFDAVWAMTAHAAGVPAVLFSYAHPTVPYVLNLQEGDPPEHVERTMRLLWPLFRRSFIRAAVVQPLSTYLAEWARRRGFTGPIEIIPNGVDAARFAADVSAVQRNELRDQWGARMGDVFLITTSRLVRKNAVDVCIASLPRMPGHVKLVVCGTGPEEAHLKEQVCALGLTSRVVFAGLVDHRDLPRYLHAADIFIRPSRSEGFGASFVEAMAAGLPVIATQVGGIADFVFDEKRNPDQPITGWAVDVDSPESVVAAVNDIMDRPEKMRAVVATARQLVKEKYDWDVLASHMDTRVFSRLV